ncbi:chemotaxis protein CheA [bacterium]|nr:chemotaxis protein CheA [bacterium]
MNYNPEEYKEILSIFKAESEEIIQSLNDGFMELEKDPEDKTPIKKLFQSAHSIKGAARMLGFNGIQDIAHKLEDILTFWKKDGIKIDADSFDIIYDVCDFLLDAVSKSVQQQSDYYDINFAKVLTELDSFIQAKNIRSSEVSDETSSFDINSQITDINAVLLELLFVLDKGSNEENIEEIIMVISDNLDILHNLFQKSGFEELSNHISLIISQLSSSINNPEKLEIIKEKIIELKTKIYDTLNVSFMPISKPHSADAENIEDTKINDDKVEESFSFIQKNVSKIKNDKKFFNQLKPKFELIESSVENQNVKDIINKIVSILELLHKDNKSIDNDCYMTILQGLYFAKKINSDNSSATLGSFNLLMQRLNVVEDILLGPKKSEILISSKKSDVNSVQSHPDIDIIKRNLNSYELQEIKTLRVDSSKVDNLISQTGELLINGIKNREHLRELSDINLKLIQWNSEGKKIVNYLKYLEKRGFFSLEYDESSSLFYKKIQSFLLNNNDVINEIQNDFGHLYNIISEDDNKLHQTAMEIENIAKGIRILPLATIFHSFPRMIRDIAIENNKKIDFVVSGSDTTVDKKLIEEIKMPLIHILRNAVSHGIEAPEEREKNGKLPVGVVKLSAKQEDNNVILTIEDDGYGINLEKVKKSAIKRGLLLTDEVDNFSNEQLMKLLFLPGFSTNESIDEISGRGIGLDIVKTKINNLNGDIQIDSVLNKGCRVTIKLPLAMSTLKTFIILINEQKYAIPVSAIKFVKKIKKEEIFIRNNVSYIIYDGHSIPIHSLSNVFGEKFLNIQDGELTIIIVENQDQQVAFIVDKLLGDQEVFHKKLVPPIVKIKNISGFTTLSTGEICLIINPYDLIKNTTSTMDDHSFISTHLNDKADFEKCKKLKVLFYDDGNINYIREDLINEFESIVSFDNVYVLYDYLQKNDVDLFISKINYQNDELISLFKFIKNDENLNKIKIVVFSDMASLDLKTVMRQFNPDLYVKTEDYDKEHFLISLKEYI